MFPVRSRQIVSKYSQFGRRNFSNALHINVWSNPRTAAVSLMQSFGQRSDTSVFDEPIYLRQKAEGSANFDDYLSPELTKDKGLISSCNEELRTLIETNEEKNDGGIYYYKHNAKLLDYPLQCKTTFNLLFGNNESNVRNILLTRNPRELVVSMENALERECDYVQDSGYVEMMKLFDEVRGADLPYIPVIKHSELISRPEHVLRSLCELFGIEFETSMLSWARGGYLNSNSSTSSENEDEAAWGKQWYLNAKRFNKFDGPKYGTLKPWKYVKIHGVKQEETIKKWTDIYDKMISTNYLRAKALLWDKRNKNIIVGVNGRLVARSEAKVSVWDSAVWGGDAVWEGIRIYNGKLFAFNKHLQRLFDSSRATNMEWVPDYNDIFKQVCWTLNANEMYDNAHIRLTLTRGEKVMAGPSQYLCQSKPCLIVLAEWKKPVFDNRGGARLVTVALRRNSPLNLDSKIHHTNMLNNIMAKIQADYCEAEDALMLDNDGYVAETNATNLFIVKNNVLLTPTPDFCLPGITRSIIIDYIAGNPKNDIKFRERRISLSEVHSADEVFMVGTMGEITPVLEVDNRMIKDGLTGPMTMKIQKLFRKLTNKEANKSGGLSTAIDKTITKEVEVATWQKMDYKSYWKMEQEKDQKEKEQLLKFN